VWRPPATAGDALEAAAAAPAAVVLVDGLFDRSPAVKHKELLALLGQGVPVIGGASMGALRAAELRTFGMAGVGRIFEAYARGRLTADDEVALLHGPAELAWAALTVPLVNVRATLLSARRQRAVDAAAARELLVAARAIFYADRTWAEVMEAARVAKAAREAFAAWLVAGEVDLKRHDARACLAAAGSARPMRIRPQVAATAFTRDLALQLAAGLKPTPEPSPRP
jgi:hypothetical protein